MLSVPDSFCAISTRSSSKELLGLVLSLAHHHPNANMVCMVDTPTKNLITKECGDVKLNIEFLVTLNKYTPMNRKKMERLKIWSTFQMMKAEVIRHALTKYKDTLFLDSDLFILGKIDDIDKSKDLGVSPHYMAESKCKRFGYYNGGLLWCKNKDIPDNWIKFTKTSRYYDQASIEDLAKHFSYFEFDKNYNLGQWRFNTDKKRIRVNNDEKIIVIKCKKDIEKELKIIHIHFHKYTSFKNVILQHLRTLKRIQEISFIKKILS